MFRPEKWHGFGPGFYSVHDTKGCCSAACLRLLSSVGGAAAQMRDPQRGALLRHACAMSLSLLLPVAALTERPPLHLAAATGDAAAVKSLLAQAAPSGWSAWFQQAPSVDARDEEGRVALHAAAESNAGEQSRLTVAALLDAGSSVNAADATGCTPLLLAAAAGDAEMCDVLLAADADPDAATSAESEKFAERETPLMAAGWGGHAEAIEVLLQSHASTELRMSSGNTALHEAVEAGQERGVRALLKGGADPNARGSDGELTPLHNAVWQFHRNDHAEVDGSGRRVATAAAVAATLLENGADPTLMDGNGHSPVHHAAADGKPGILKLLLKSSGVDGGLAREPTRGGVPPLILVSTKAMTLTFPLQRQFMGWR